MRKPPKRTAVILALAMACLEAVAAECRLDSPMHRVALVELYTSEGCSSCPPADRWLSGLPEQGVRPDNAVLLAFHVDYWDQLGWLDRFSSPRFSERQRQAAARSAAGFVYTPQVMVGGRDFRAARSRTGLERRLAGINRSAAGARIRSHVQDGAAAWWVTGEVALADAEQAPAAQLWIAVYENGLSTEVRAGENAGARLHHDYVVRSLAGPFAIPANGRATFDHRIAVDPGWSLDRAGLALFVQHAGTGEVLQAVSRHPVCPA